MLAVLLATSPPELSASHQELPACVLTRRRAAYRLPFYLDLYAGPLTARPAWQRASTSPPAGATL
jgi:hypothetical protein